MLSCYSQKEILYKGDETAGLQLVLPAIVFVPLGAMMPNGLHGFEMGPLGSIASAPWDPMWA